MNPATLITALLIIIAILLIVVLYHLTQVTMLMRQHYDDERAVNKLITSRLSSRQSKTRSVVQQSPIVRPITSQPTTRRAQRLPGAKTRLVGGEDGGA